MVAQRWHSNRQGFCGVSWRLWVIAIGALLLVIAAGGYGLRLWRGSKTTGDAVGFVLDCKQEWNCDPPDVTIRPGQELRAGQRLVPQDTQRPGWIKVHYHNGTIATYQEAHRLEPLESAKTPGLLGRLQARLQHRYVALTREAIARGVETGLLADAVIKADTSELDLSEPFHGLAAGEYYGQLDAILSSADDALAWQSVKPDVAKLVEFEHTRERAAQWPARNISPGLYRLTVYRDPDDGAMADQCVLLIVPADAYARVHTAYAEAVQRLDAQQRPGEMMSKSYGRSLLRAYLACLAETGEE